MSWTVKGKSYGKAVKDEPTRDVQKGTVETEAVDQLHADLWTAYHEQMLSDFTVVVEGGKEFRAHKVVLAARSKPLRAMVESKMKEGIAGRAELKDVQPEAMEEFLKFLYTGNIKLDLPKVIAMDLFEVADKYEVLTLVPLCVKRLKKVVNKDNLVDILCLAGIHNNEDLKKVCMEYLEYNHKEVRKTEQWENFHQRNPKLYEETVEKLLDGCPQKRETYWETAVTFPEPAVVNDAAW